MLTKCESHLELLLERVDVQRIEPACLGSEPRRTGKPLQRRPTPQRESGRNRVRCNRDVSVAKRGACLPEQLLELGRVEACAVERVTVRRADDRFLAERGAEAGDVMVEGVPRGGRKLLLPHAVDERVDVNHPSAAKREHCKQGLALHAADVCERPTHVSLERAEKSDIKQLLHASGYLPR